MRLMAAIAAFLSPTLVSGSEPSPVMSRVGDTYEISRDLESSQRGTDGSTGSSTDRDTITERVIGVRENGLELEYDLPAEATAEERAANWQFPARVFKPFRGSMQLLNRAELEARVGPWLRAGEMTRASCGHWIFTWNAFRIDCDPESVIQTLAQFDLGPGDLREGALIEDPQAQGSAPLRRTRAGADGATFVVLLSVDPDVVRRERAQSEAVFVELTGGDTTFDAVRRALSVEEASGSITITLDTDPAGRVRRRVKVTQLEIRESSGRVQSQTITETLERRLLR